jgi:hypothetical protein
MENSISIILPFVIPRACSRLFPLRTSIAVPSERAGTFAPVRAQRARVRSQKTY